MLSPVPPAYSDFRLALVMHSNEGGPGPRHNMKENPGSSTLIMLKDHGCHLYLMPWFSEAGDNRNRRMGLPPTTATGTEPPPTPFKYTLHPLPKYWSRPASEKTHFGLWYEVRGHGLGKRMMWRPL
jgi:hypothetical protein